MPRSPGPTSPAPGWPTRSTVHVGPAIDTLPTLTGPYDLVFIDADKKSNPDYVRAALG